MRTFFVAVAAMLACVVSAQASELASRVDFVRVHGTGLEINGQPYHFLGTNFWYGMNLGHERLVRELDRLKVLGVTNLRVLAGSEGPDSEPWRIVPALQAKPGELNKVLLQGLDRLFIEMRKRDMRAVVVLNNFWPWSGGMAQYLAWSGAGSIPYPPPADGGDWNTYQRYTAGFYTNARAVALFNAFVSKIVKRYSGTPTIMAWELCNEPRGVQNTAAFNAWLDKTAALIKSIDRNHLITTGSEGDTPSPLSAGNDFIANHSSRNIDYATIHIWAQNWGWFDPKLATETFETAVAKMKEYLRAHVAKARALGKPLVVEEFGLARDGGSYVPAATVHVRDRYYEQVFHEVYAQAAAGEPVAGVNFWAWGGEARPRAPGGIWRKGDPFVGDPPHELQGWYSVYDTDATTLRLISDYAAKLRAL